MTDDSEKINFIGELQGNINIANKRQRIHKINKQIKKEMKKKVYIYIYVQVQAIV